MHAADKYQFGHEADQKHVPILIEGMGFDQITKASITPAIKPSGKEELDETILDP